MHIFYYLQGVLLQVCGIDRTVDLHVVDVPGVELLRVFYYASELYFGIGQDELKAESDVLPLRISREDFHLVFGCLGSEL